MNNPAIIGKSIPRLDAPAKVTGKALYAGDLKMPAMLYGKILHSPLAHAKIKRIDVSQAKALPGVKDVITGADIPQVKYGNWRLVPQSQDELALAVDKGLVGPLCCARSSVLLGSALRVGRRTSVLLGRLPGIHLPDPALLCRHVVIRRGPLLERPGGPPQL